MPSRLRTNSVLLVSIVCSTCKRRTFARSSRVPHRQVGLMDDRKIRRSLRKTPRVSQRNQKAYAIVYGADLAGGSGCYRYRGQVISRAGAIYSRRHTGDNITILPGE